MKNVFFIFFILCFIITCSQKRENATKAKCGHNLKYDTQVLRRAGIELTGIAAASMLVPTIAIDSIGQHPCLHLG